MLASSPQLMLVTLKPDLSQLSTRGLKFDLDGIDVNKENDIFRHLANLATAGAAYRTTDRLTRPIAMAASAPIAWSVPDLVSHALLERPVVDVLPTLFNALRARTRVVRTNSTCRRETFSVRPDYRLAGA